MNIRTITESDRSWAADVVAQHFCTPEIISRGVRHDTRSLPGLVVEDAKARLGLVHYCIVGTRCEVVAIVVLQPRQGLGRRLMEALGSVARAHGCACLWLVTTNDNRAAQAFYAALGWRLVAVHRRAVAVARRQKSEIPERAADGTRIEDELEYELGFVHTASGTPCSGRRKC